MASESRASTIAKPELDLSELELDLVTFLTDPRVTHEERVEALLLAVVRELVKVKEKT